MSGNNVGCFWQKMVCIARRNLSGNSFIDSFLEDIVFSSKSFGDALSKVLTKQTQDAYVSKSRLQDLCLAAYNSDPDILFDAMTDLSETTCRDPAATDELVPFLFFKGFHALQTHRVAHWLWNNDRKYEALYLQSRSSLVYTVDIHPAAKIGRGIMLDHATAIVVGETAVIGNNVSILHNVTLGGTGKELGDRHPKIGDGVMIGAGSKILGNINVGKGSSIAAGSVVLHEVPPHVTVAGVPAKIVGTPKSAVPASDMCQDVV